ncbi:hypothetical protein Gotri_025998 [Gossypium trilobum]|uniref:Uncharacterized protein n=1 Tax=Gossypium trilobum TaxID=34281 RepID=A0A7J9FHT6_9ROSI|nr:hypothetical protein [Gossypium trilobum]
MISTMFSFQRVHNLGHYLGVPLFHQRITSSTLQFVMEKVRGKLQSWEAKNLFITGRITLAQSIYLSIPSYFMQPIMIPRKIHDEIERHIPSNVNLDSDCFLYKMTTEARLWNFDLFRALKEGEWNPKYEKWKMTPPVLFVLEALFMIKREIGLLDITDSLVNVRSLIQNSGAFLTVSNLFKEAAMIKLSFILIVLEVTKTILGNSSTASALIRRIHDILSQENQ